MSSSRIAVRLALFLLALLSLHATGATALPAGGTSDQGGIKEVIPAKYASRCLGGKRISYPCRPAEINGLLRINPQFTLNITISADNTEGAPSGKYRWDQSGKLVAATITLGSRLNDGYPNPIYFPVMNSLVDTEQHVPISGSTLAATKIAHEFGHVLRTAQVDAHLYQLQTQLIPQYNKIFLNNGRRVDDPKLLELVKQMVALRSPFGKIASTGTKQTPCFTSAIAKLKTACAVSCSVRNRHSIDLYAKQYENCFFEIARSNPSTKICGWQ